MQYEDHGEKRQGAERRFITCVWTNRECLPVGHRARFTVGLMTSEYDDRSTYSNSSLFLILQCFVFSIFCGRENPMVGLNFSSVCTRFVKSKVSFMMSESFLHRFNRFFFVFVMQRLLHFHRFCHRQQRVMVERRVCSLSGDLHSPAGNATIVSHGFLIRFQSGDIHCQTIHPTRECRRLYQGLEFPLN